MTEQRLADMRRRLERILSWPRAAGPGVSDWYVADVSALLERLANASAALSVKCRLLSDMQAALGVTVTDGTDGDPVEWCKKLRAERDALRLQARMAEDQIRQRMVPRMHELATERDRLRAFVRALAVCKCTYRKPGDPRQCPEYSPAGWQWCWPCRARRLLEAGAV